MALNKALVVIDVQTGITRGKAMHPDWSGILGNITSLIERAREAKLPVIFVQHDGPAGDLLEHGAGGWQLDPGLSFRAGDPLIHKKACDAFYETTLESALRERGVDEIIVAGCMTEFCVDTSVRRAVTLGFDVTLVADGHGTWDSKLLTAAQIVEHHNHVLNGIDAGKAAVKVRRAADVALVRA